jgi:hypothetical protein
VLTVFIVQVPEINRVFPESAQANERGRCHFDLSSELALSFTSTVTGEYIRRCPSLFFLRCAVFDRLTVLWLISHILFRF